MDLIHALQRRLINYVADDRLELLFKALKQLLPFDNADIDIHNEVVLLESRLYSNKHKLLKSVVTPEDSNTELNSIKESLLLIVKDLDKKSIIATEKQAFRLLEKLETESELPPPDNSNGAVLHRIPEQMEVAKAVRCFVRMAFEESKLYENPKATAEEIQNLETIGDAVEVTLLDPGKDGHFEIKAITDAEQIIRRDDYTEWIFHVKPLIKGTHPLSLKIAVVENINGKERIKNIVVNKDVEIVAHPVPPRRQKFTPVDYAFNLKSGTDQNDFVPPVASGVAGKKTAGLGLLPILLTAAVILLPLGYFLFKMYDGSSKENLWRNECLAMWEEARKENTCAAIKAFREVGCFPETWQDSIANQLTLLSCDIKPKEVVQELVMDLIFVKDENLLVSLTTGGVAPYQWEIVSDSTVLAEGTFEKPGTDSLDVYDCCQKSGTYNFVLYDEQGQKVSAAFEVPEVTVSAQERPISVDWDIVGNYLEFSIINGEAPYKINFNKIGLKTNHAAKLSGSKRSSHKLDIKNLQSQYPGTYQLTIKDNAGKRHVAEFPVKWNCTEINDYPLKYSEDCWDVVQQQAASKQNSFFTYFYNPDSYKGKRMECTMRNKAVIDFAEAHFFYNKKNVKETDRCEDFVSKSGAEPPVIEFFEPDGKSMRKITGYKTPAELLAIMKELAWNRRLNLPGMTVDIITLPTYDTPEGYLMFENSPDKYRWVNRTNMSKHLLQIAAVDNLIDACYTARCMQMEGLENPVYIHKEGDGAKALFKVLLGGFKDASELNDFKKWYNRSRETICQEYLKNAGASFTYKMKD